MNKIIRIYNGKIKIDEENLMNKFKIKSKYKPTGDQPKAINGLVQGLKKGLRDQTLLGVTGSGKTFTMANIIESVQKPTLIISHNKTLAAQLYGEFKQFFPENAVHYFVSYYDYYQPEAYIPHSDVYIEKESSINEDIDRLRHATTQSLINRDDVIVVASVSCIYGIGEKEDYESLGKEFRVGDNFKRNEIVRRLVSIQYDRNDEALGRGQFRVKGENIDIHLATGEAVVRIKVFGDYVDDIFYFQKGPKYEASLILSGLIEVPVKKMKQVNILPAKHFVTPEYKMKRAFGKIERELEERLKDLKKRGNY